MPREGAAAAAGSAAFDRRTSADSNETGAIAADPPPFLCRHATRSHTRLLLAPLRERPQTIPTDRGGSRHRERAVDQRERASSSASALETPVGASAPQCPQ